MSRLAFVLTHEMAHIRRFDALSKLLLGGRRLSALVQSPGVGDAGPSQPGSGLSCDAAVVRLYGAEAPPPMPAPLLELEARRSRFLPLCSAFQQKRPGGAHRRHHALPQTSAAALAVALVLVVALTAVLATNAPPGKADRLRLPA